LAENNININSANFNNLRRKDEKVFFDIFNKYFPTEMEKNILNRASDIKIFADREKRLIDVHLSFDNLIEKDFLHRIEQKLCETYNLSKMSFLPKYKKELFCEDYFQEIVAEAKIHTANTCFLNDSGIKFEDGYNIKIYLAHGGKNYLEDAAKFIDLLKKIIASEFDFAADITLGGVTALYKNDEQDIINTKKNIDEIEAVARKVQAEAHKARQMQEEAEEREIREEKKKKIYAKTNNLSVLESSPVETDNFNKSNRSINLKKINNLNNSDTPSTCTYDEEKNILQAGYLKIDFNVKKPVFNKSGNENEFEEIIPDDIAPISAVDGDMIYNSKNGGFTVTCGRVFDIDVKDMRRTGKKSVNMKITNYDSSISTRFIGTNEEASKILNNINPEDCVIITGETAYNDFDEELCINLESVFKTKEIIKIDTAEKKRIELHLHTTMSSMDATIKPDEIVRYARDIGHTAVAVTDHGNVQGFPEAMIQKEKLKLKDGESFKVIYGLEGYLLDDSDHSVFGNVNARFSEDTFVVFDIETTGLSPFKHAMTEIGAVRIKAGEIIEEFNTFVNPEQPISKEITDLTGITDEMVKDAPKIKKALRSFLDFAGHDMLVAHNASFDISFIKRYSELCKYSFTNPYLDTVAMSRNINKDLKNHKLDTLVNFYKIKDFHHHRACDDARALAQIFMNMTEQLKSFGVSTVFEMNETAGGAEKQNYHIILLVKNKTGLKNLYKIVSASYLDHFYKKPRIPKSVLAHYRDGIIIGSACEAGELFTAVVEGKKENDLKQIAEFYDYLEVQSIGNNMFLVNDGVVPNEETLKNYNKIIIELGEKINKPVVATGDVHFLRRHDEIARKILLRGMNFKDADKHIPLYFRTTEEMLEEFAYIPKEKAYEIVVENTNKIADMIEDVRPIPEGSYTPKMEGAEERLREICYQNAREMYKDPLPPEVADRLERELVPIISNGFAVLYIIAVDLIKKSEENGYLVGSRGSVGSSFVATMAGISEVNPLPPHYYCKNKTCGFKAEFIAGGSYGSGYDLPEKNCPMCGEKLAQEGQDIPFETFLGFKGEKSPDIDLNFSGAVQATAHKYTEELFGHENVFRAGTIGALADKTAYGFIMKYLEEKKINLNKAHTDWLVTNCVGVKRTTGQHPGGIIVVPREYEIYDFTPIQHPADDVKSGVVTTHFAFEFLHDTILKLDLLGHDVPTKYRVLKDMTGIDVRDLPMNDKNVMELFISTKSIGVNSKDIYNELGTFGIPEVGTKFVRQMILETKPKSFADLLQISGLSHGTSVWLGNAQELIKSNTCTLPEVIGLRDDIMLYLMHKNIDSSTAFIITESVRKGKGLTPDWEKIMREHNVPEWYVDSCKKIKYMFPKAHASAYIIAAMRLGWFKVYKPLEFYASYFSVQPEGFDAELALSGRDKIRQCIEETEKKGIEATKKEEDIMTAMLLVLEMYARNLKFLPVDIYKSAAFEYKIEDGKIRLPLSSLNGVGENAAENIAKIRDDAIRENGEIFSVEDIQKKAKLTKTVVDTLRRNKVFGKIPETDQISLF